MQLLVLPLLIATSLRLAERILGRRPPRFLCRISYGTYLLHFAVIAAAYLAHILIERPARGTINRWFDRRRETAPDDRREPTFERAP